MKLLISHLLIYWSCASDNGLKQRIHVHITLYFIKHSYISFTSKGHILSILSLQSARGREEEVIISISGSHKEQMAEWAQETRSPHSSFWFWTWISIRVTWDLLEQISELQDPSSWVNRANCISTSFLGDADVSWTGTTCGQPLRLNLTHSCVCVTCMPFTPDLDTVHKMKTNMSQKGDGKKIKISLGLLPPWPWPLTLESRVYHHYCCPTMPWDLSGHS